MRWLLPLVVISACDRGGKEDAANLDACVARVVVAEAAASERAVGMLTDGLTLLPDVATKDHALRLTRAIHAEATRANPQPAAMLDAMVATKLAPLGDIKGAEKLARNAIASNPPTDGYDSVAADAALVIAWAGDLTKAQSVAKDDPARLLLVAQGAAYAGNTAAAKELLAKQRDRLVDDLHKALAIQGYGLVHDVDGARALIATMTDRQTRAYGEAMLVRALEEAKHPKALDHVRTSARNITDAIDEAFACCADETATLVTMLADVSIVMHDLGDKNGAKQLRDMARGKVAPFAAEAAIVKSQLAATAQLAGDTATADELMKELGDKLYPTQRIHILNERGDFKNALELYPTLVQDKGLAALSIAGFLGKRPHDRALDDKFRALVCK